jgi:hypothetical protein
VISVDIGCDLMDEDEAGFVWAFLREARDPGLVKPGATVLVGDADTPAVAEVIDIADRPSGTIAHLRILSHGAHTALRVGDLDDGVRFRWPVDHGDGDGLCRAASGVGDQLDGGSGGVGVDVHDDV